MISDDFMMLLDTICVYAV